MRRGIIYKCGSALCVVSCCFIFAAQTVQAASFQSPVLTSQSTSANENDGVETFVFTLTNNGSGEPVTVSYSTVDGSATAGQDYQQELNQTFLVVPGKSATLSIPIYSDALQEGDETFSIVVAQSQFYTQRQNKYTAQIIDNYTPPVVTPVVPVTPVTPVTPTPKPATPTTTPDPTPTTDSGPVTDTTPVVTATSLPAVLPSPTPSAAGPPQTLFVQSVHSPADTPKSGRQLGISLLLALLLILLILFPADMFNSTLLGNYAEISGWFKLPKLRKLAKRLRKIPRIVPVVLFGVVGALINSQLSPDFGFNQKSLALLVGMFLALAICALVYDQARAFYMRKRFGIAAKLQTYTLGITTAIILVVISRVAHFLPGYCYGLFTALAFRKVPTDEQDGEGLAVASLGLLVVGVLGWFALVPIQRALGHPGASFGLQVLNTSLASLWVTALAAIVFGLAPIRYFYGEQVKKWNAKAWLVIYTIGLTLFIYTLLDPKQTVYGHSSQASLISVLVLFGGFGIFSLSFWGYFRYRYLWRHVADSDEIPDIH